MTASLQNEAGEWINPGDWIEFDTEDGKCTGRFSGVWVNPNFGVVAQTVFTKQVAAPEIPSAPWAQQLCIEVPQKGCVYTVRRIVQRAVDDGGNPYGIMLDEILNLKTFLDRMCEGGEFLTSDKRMSPPDEVAFDSRDFRPLITIEKFATTDQKVDA